MKGYVSGSFCDYQTLLGLNGQSFDVVLHLKDGGQYGTNEVNTLVVSGFKATINTYFGIPLAENRMQSYPLWINFESYDEFLNGYLVNPTYTFRSILDYVPVGMALGVTRLLSTSTADVKVTNRSTGEVIIGLLAADFSSISSNAADVDITSASDGGDGTYVLTIQKAAGTTPADLGSGEYAVIQATQDDSTNYTYASNLITLIQA